MNKAVPANDVKFVLRLPKRLHSYLQAMAKNEHASMNATLIKLIDEHAHPEFTLPTLFKRLEDAGVLTKVE